MAILDAKPSAPIAVGDTLLQTAGKAGVSVTVTGIESHHRSYQHATDAAKKLAKSYMRDAVVVLGPKGLYWVCAVAELNNLAKKNRIASTVDLRLQPVPKPKFQGSVRALFANSAALNPQVVEIDVHEPVDRNRLRKPQPAIIETWKSHPEVKSLGVVVGLGGWVPDLRSETEPVHPSVLARDKAIETLVRNKRIDRKTATLLKSTSVHLSAQMGWNPALRRNLGRAILGEVDPAKVLAEHPYRRPELRSVRIDAMKNLSAHLHHLRTTLEALPKGASLERTLLSQDLRLVRVRLGQLAREISFDGHEKAAHDIWPARDAIYRLQTFRVNFHGEELTAAEVVKRGLVSQLSPADRKRMTDMVLSARKAYEDVHVAVKNAAKLLNGKPTTILKYRTQVSAERVVVDGHRILGALRKLLEPALKVDDTARQWHSLTHRINAVLVHEGRKPILFTSSKEIEPRVAALIDELKLPKKEFDGLSTLDRFAKVTGYLSQRAAYNNYLKQHHVQPLLTSLSTAEIADRNKKLAAALKIDLRGTPYKGKTPFQVADLLLRAAQRHEGNQYAKIFGFTAPDFKNKTSMVDTLTEMAKVLQVPLGPKGLQLETLSLKKLTETIWPQMQARLSAQYEHVGQGVATLLSKTFGVRPVRTGTPHAMGVNMAELRSQLGVGAPDGSVMNKGLGAAEIRELSLFFMGSSPKGGFRTELGKALQKQVAEAAILKHETIRTLLGGGLSDKSFAGLDFDAIESSLYDSNLSTEQRRAVSLLIHIDRDGKRGPSELFTMLSVQGKGGKVVLSGDKLKALHQTLSRFKLGKLRGFPVHLLSARMWQGLETAQEILKQNGSTLGEAQFEKLLRTLRGGKPPYSSDETALFVGLYKARHKTDLHQLINKKFADQGKRRGPLLDALRSIKPISLDSDPGKFSAVNLQRWMKQYDRPAGTPGKATESIYARMWAGVPEKHKQVSAVATVGGDTPRQLQETTAEIDALRQERQTATPERVVAIDTKIQGMLGHLELLKGASRSYEYRGKNAGMRAYLTQVESLRRRAKGHLLAANQAWRAGDAQKATAAYKLFSETHSILAKALNRQTSTLTATREDEIAAVERRWAYAKLAATVVVTTVMTGGLGTVGAVAAVGRGFLALRATVATVGRMALPMAWRTGVTTLGIGATLDVARLAWEGDTKNFLRNLRDSATMARDIGLTMGLGVGLFRGLAGANATLRHQVLVSSVLNPTIDVAGLALQGRMKDWSPGRSLSMALIGGASYPAAYWSAVSRHFGHVKLVGVNATTGVAQNGTANLFEGVDFWANPERNWISIAGAWASTVAAPRYVPRRRKDEKPVFSANVRHDTDLSNKHRSLLPYKITQIVRPRWQSVKRFLTSQRIKAVDPLVHPIKREFVLDLLKAKEPILVAGSLPPDFDSVTATYMIVQALRAMGKKAYAVVDAEMSAPLQAYAKRMGVMRASELEKQIPGFKPEAVILADGAEIGRIGGAKKWAGDAPMIFTIDHHQYRPDSTSLKRSNTQHYRSFQDEHADSASSMALSLIRHIEKIRGVPFSRENWHGFSEAAALGILSDTGYRHPLSKVSDLGAGKVRWLIEQKGLNIKGVEKTLAWRMPRQLRNIVDDQTVSGKMENKHGYTTVEFIGVRTADLKTVFVGQRRGKKLLPNAQDAEGHLRDRIDFAVDPKNPKVVSVAILFIQTPKGVVVSVRSASKDAAQRIAREFGGGGKDHSAGFMLKGHTLTAAIDKMRTWMNTAPEK